jgi:hypothetical protein
MARAATPAAGQAVPAKFLPWIGDVVSHPARDGHWGDLTAIEDCARSPRRPEIGGWHDLCVNEETLRAYTRMRRHGGRSGRDPRRAGAQLLRVQGRIRPVTPSAGTDPHPAGTRAIAGPAGARRGGSALDGLGLQELLQAEAAVFAAVAGLLVAAEGG